MDASANLEEPAPLKFNQKFAQQYDECKAGKIAQTSTSTTTSCLPASTLHLPITQSLKNLGNKFVKLTCHLAKETDYLCGKQFLECLSLPAKDDFKVIAVPMDCGDFSYRYYLL